jgi:hypothetical protein
VPDAEASLDNPDVGENGLPSMFVGGGGENADELKC